VAKTPLERGTAPTLADLQVLWGGRDRLRRVAEVAQLLAVVLGAVYQMCENGDRSVSAAESLRGTTKLKGVHEND
jgi:hypothetical protein